ncbi:MAG: T9SS type A sorting domain-containing protein, partial [Bacteroidia bacterium]|nr:T9SS type A sorting domain-containing protein [Bacteroidia bacterium]
HDLTESNYEFYMTQGEFTERFEIVFKAVDDEVADSDEDNPIDEDNTEDEDSFEDGDLIEEDISNGNIEPGTLNAYFSNDKDSIILVNPSNETIESVRLINVIGQIIYSVENINSEVDYTEYRVSNLSTGTYILKIDAESGSLTKKVLIE